MLCEEEKEFVVERGVAGDRGEEGVVVFTLCPKLGEYCGLGGLSSTKPPLPTVEVREETPEDVFDDLNGFEVTGGLLLVKGLFVPELKGLLLVLPLPKILDANGLNGLPLAKLELLLLEIDFKACKSVESLVCMTVTGGGESKFISSATSSPLCSSCFPSSVVSGLLLRSL